MEVTNLPLLTFLIGVIIGAGISMVLPRKKTLPDGYYYIKHRKNRSLQLINITKEHIDNSQGIAETSQIVESKTYWRLPRRFKNSQFTTGCIFKKEGKKIEIRKNIKGATKQN